jgi:thymidylate synthase
VWGELVMPEWNATNAIYQSIIEEVLKEEEITTRNSVAKRAIAVKRVLPHTPLVSIRKTAWKSAIREWEYFMKGATTLDEMHPSIHPWWEPFCVKTPNTMSHSYGQSMRKIYCPNEAKVIKINVRSSQDTTKYPEFVDDLQTGESGELTGKVFKNSKGLEYTVLNKVTTKGTNTVYNLKFTESGWTTTGRSDVIQLGSIKDKYHKSYYGVGSVGNPNKQHPMWRKAREIWDHMMQRCFDPNNSNFCNYGKVGVTVSNRWRCFELFLDDLAKLPGYEEWLQSPSNYQLDKDYYGTSLYSHYTCVFLPKGMNSRLSKSSGKWSLIKDGIVVSEFLNKSSMYSYLSLGRGQSLKKIGYSAIKEENTEDSVFRNPLTVDQVANFVDGVKNHPYSRRNILTTWIPQHVEAGLVNPTNCHNTLTQAFVTSNGYLNLVTYQRSCDLICGVPHNWIQLYAFHLWLCKQTDWRVGNITWIGGDVHIYQQHYDLANKILDIQYNKVDPIPDLWYKPSSVDFKADDFQLDGDYKPTLTDRAEMIV